MTTLHLDGATLTTPEEVHRVFAQMLHVPDWYGNNLDALYDLLTSLPETHIILYHVRTMETHLGRYATRLLNTLRDATSNHPALTVTLLP